MRRGEGPLLAGEALKIPTGRRQTSWLFYKHGGGFGLITTKSKSSQQDLNFKLQVQRSAMLPLYFTHAHPFITMIIIVFLTLYIDPLSSKTNKTMIKFLTQYLQSLGQQESLHAWKHLVRKQLKCLLTCIRTYCM